MSLHLMPDLQGGEEHCTFRVERCKGSFCCHPPGDLREGHQTELGQRERGGVPVHTMARAEPHVFGTCWVKKSVVCVHYQMQSWLLECCEK